ncbi:MAG: transporter substrate-binding domain-containing protein, partial [Rhodospirillaceae bacterium]
MRLLFIAVGACLLGACADAEPQSQLERIKTRGFLTCGVWTGIEGFASVDEQGRYSGMDVDVCRAVSAAIFGSPDNVRYVRAENVQQMTEDDEIDIVSRRITWTLTYAAPNNLIFGPVIFYDGQGFLTPTNNGISSAEALQNKTVCVQTEEAHAATLASYSLEHGLNISGLPVESTDEVARAFENNRCVAYSADISLLGAARLQMPASPEN